MSERSLAAYTSVAPRGVSKDCCAYFAHERIVLTLALLRSADTNDLSFPIDVLKAKEAHLAAAYAVHGDDQ
jgi:hypothetical protein